MPISEQERDKILALAERWNQARVDWHYASPSEATAKGNRLGRAARSLRTFLDSITEKDSSNGG